MMHWDGGGMGLGGGILGGLAVLVVLALAAVGAVALLRDWRGGASSERRRAEQVLDERFARGEIDVEEYVRHRELLRAGR